jgi:hypothetical protein
MRDRDGKRYRNPNRGHPSDPAEETIIAKFKVFPTESVSPWESKEDVDIIVLTKTKTHRRHHPCELQYDSSQVLMERDARYVLRLQY